MVYENSNNKDKLYKDIPTPLESKFATFLARNQNSFFKIIPPNSPIKVMAHVYIIKVKLSKEK